MLSMFLEFAGVIKEDAKYLTSLPFAGGTVIVNSSLSTLWLCQTILLRKRVPRRIQMPVILHNVSHFARHLAPKHLLHPRQRHVHPRTRPRARPHVPISHPPRLGNPRDVRAAGRRQRPSRLVGRSSLPIQHPGSGREPGARAHGDEVLQGRVGVPDEVDYRADVFEASALTARDD